MIKLQENEVVEAGGIATILGSIFMDFTEMFTPADFNDWLQVSLAILGVVFMITRIRLNIEKRRGQKIRNQLDQKELDKKNKSANSRKF